MDVYLDVCFKQTKIHNKITPNKIYGLLFFLLTGLTTCLSQTYWLLPAVFLTCEVYLIVQDTIVQPKQTGIRFFNSKPTRFNLYLHLVVFFLCLYVILFFSGGEMFVSPSIIRIGFAKTALKFGSSLLANGKKVAGENTIYSTLKTSQNAIIGASAVGIAYGGAKLGVEVLGTLGPLVATTIYLGALNARDDLTIGFATIKKMILTHPQIVPSWYYKPLPLNIHVHWHMGCMASNKKAALRYTRVLIEEKAKLHREELLRLMKERTGSISF